MKKVMFMDGICKRSAMCSGCAWEQKPDKRERTQGTIKNHRSGSAARQGGAPTLPTSAAIDRVLGENGKKLFFLLLLL